MHSQYSLHLFIPTTYRMHAFTLTANITFTTDHQNDEDILLFFEHHSNMSIRILWFMHLALQACNKRREKNIQYTNPYAVYYKKYSYFFNLCTCLPLNCITTCSFFVQQWFVRMLHVVQVLILMRLWSCHKSCSCCIF